MIRDKEMDHPISVKEQYLEEITGEALTWIKNLDDVQFMMEAVAAVVLDRPQQLKVPQPVLPGERGCQYSEDLLSEPSSSSGTSSMIMPLQMNLPMTGMGRPALPLRHLMSICPAKNLI
jgi:hypothetical protein